MTRSFLPLAAALVVALGFTTPAAAQEPAGAMDFSAFGQRLTALEQENADLRRRVAALEGLKTSPVKAAAPCGCPLLDCLCGQPCPCPAAAPAVTATLAATRAAVGHTHTCPRCGTTWDHVSNPGHSCPRCQTEQWVQDAFPRPVSVSAGSPYSGGSVVSGCASGACPPQYSTTRTGFRLFRR